MKHYFVGWAFVVGFLVLSALARGQTPNLQLILEGPFVVCEDSNTGGLNIGVPNLQNTHYVPGISSDVGDLSFGAGRQGNQYHDAMDDVESVMTLRWNSSGAQHVMNLNPPNGQIASRYFYVEKGYCDEMGRGLESVLLKVPVPDEVLTYRPTDDFIYIADHNDNTIKGVCTQKGGCPYATKIVLHYLNVDFNSIDIETTCSGKGPCTSPDRDSWRPGAAAAIGSELALELKAEPVPWPDVPSERDHARTAFWAASRLAGNYRDLMYGAGSAAADSAVDPSLVDAVLNRVCQVPPMVLCTHGGACPKK
jgi:hypothetical protein